ncbi:glycosyltransferase [Paenarthrobacter ureafaciens]|uniref:glycosyltransferase n=1 Tax=Paenarthrobacter ureafaciens TaxID=37931 RepID=UPI001FB49C9C|nr:glycosyltransferase [Paenarthrobacter ureafaciens]UOD80477.1 glycosyltransferase [Paenarthrobacter ureafaciens]WNZ03128.1 glycosyltransferase [Paenarthrobacter ureafaciens]
MTGSAEGPGDRLWRIKKRLEELEYSHEMSDSRRGFYSSSIYVDSVLSGRPLVPASTRNEYLERRAASHRQGYIEGLRPLLDSIPASLGSRALKPLQYNVAIIADEFLYKSFDSTAKLTYVTPQNYHEVADGTDLLLIASTWRGLGGEWTGLATPGSKKRATLLENVVPFFKQQGTPVAFYSKEDPPNYSQFLEIAETADYIFTCAAESVPDYRRDCPQTASVGVLSFGVNPYHHTPVYSRRHRLPDVLFAGSWHSQRYPERRASARAIFEGVVESSRNLVIVDRNWSLENSRYFFPDEYLSHLVPSLEHDELLKLQRISDFNINLNSVISSASMYANRVVELQAMGSMVLSNYNAGVNNRFPNVLTAQTSFDIRRTLDGMSQRELYEVQMEGLRRAYSEHVALDRMAEILKTAGYSVDASGLRVCAVVQTPSEELHRVAREQTLPNLEVLSPQELQVRRRDFDVAVPLSERFTYASTHAEDLVNAFKYADVDFVVKPVPVVDAAGHVPEHELVSSMAEPPAGAVWLDSASGTAYLQDGRIEGMGYAVDPLGIFRREDSLSLVEPMVTAPLEPLLAVVVPVFNNGTFLLNKCISSLKRSSIFMRMQIILVDDGSTDLRTLRILDELDARYRQVTVFRFDDGGSGSASRARNKGLELSTAPWVTYLDPDNEAVCDGHAKLLQLAIDRSLDMAVGNMLLYADGVQTFPNARQVGSQLQAAPKDGEDAPVNLLRRLDFYPMSIQATVLNAAWLKSLCLEQTVGALGQDSFFFQQLAYYSRRTDVMDVPVHVYYGSVEGSVVNTIGPGFFRKYLPLEAARAQWLQDVNLLDEYKATRAQAFMKHWYIGKLKLVPEEELAECLAIVKELARIYDPIEWQDAGVSAILSGTTSDIHTA